MAAVLKNNIRNTDVLSRWGGDEFLILLSHTSVDEGEKIAEKLRQFVDKTSIQIKDTEIMITASFGVAVLTGNEEYSYEEAYKNADSALYQAKQNGRNRVEVFVVG
ncbi:MAG: GGDEF domain-containing protein [Clostridia bacterium]|nr:GGDEF domain-containing protein [Clostridia bacterium]